MSTIALFLVAFGIMIILSRAPLVVAPGATRNAYMSFVTTDWRMRLFGVFVAAFGAVIFWVGLTNPGIAATILTYLGVIVVAFGLGGIIPFAGAARRLAENIWNAFSIPALRAIGVTSTIAGAALIYYGFSL